MKAKKVFGWHFVGATLRDGAPIPPDGKWLEFKGPLRICESGLHGSPTPFDALRYAPGATLCYCQFEGVEQEQGDKFVARRRKIIARGDATEALNFFARMQAIAYVHLWDAPDVVLDYLAGDETQRTAAESAAWSAARSAAWSAAWFAAWSAAGSDFNALICECFEEVIR